MTPDNQTMCEIVRFRGTHNLASSDPRNSRRKRSDMKRELGITISRLLGGRQRSQIYRKRLSISL